MPPWILPGREKAPKMRYKAILEKSFAFSRTCNSRNLEYHWYPLWNQTLSDLVCDMPNPIVAPQYPVWFIPQNDEEVEGDDDTGDEDDPEEIVARRESHCAERTVLEDDDEDYEVADVSFTSTVPEKDAKSVLVDFAVLNLSAVPLNQSKPKVCYDGWRITEASVGLLVEVKRFVSRSLTGVEKEKALEKRIAEAHEDLIKQAAHLFLQDEGKNSVLAIAAAGLYWCSATIYREDVKLTMDSLRESDPTYQTLANLNAHEVGLKWNSLLRLDLALSIDRLHNIHKSLKESGVMQTPGNI